MNKINIVNITDGAETPVLYNKEYIKAPESALYSISKGETMKNIEKENKKIAHVKQFDSQIRINCDEINFVQYNTNMNLFKKENKMENKINVNIIKMLNITSPQTEKPISCGSQTTQDLKFKKGGNNMSTKTITNPTGNGNTKSQNGQILNSTKSNMSATAQKGQNMTKANTSINTISNAKVNSPSQKGQNMNKNTTPTSSTYYRQNGAIYGALRPADFANDPIFEYGNTITKIYKAYWRNKVDIDDAGYEIDDFCSICYLKIMEQQANYNPSLGNHGQHNSGIIKHTIQEISKEAEDNRENLDPNSAEYYLEGLIYQDEKDAEDIEGNTGLRTITRRKDVEAAIDHLVFKSTTRLTGYELAEANDYFDITKDAFGENSLEYKMFCSRFCSNHHISRPELAKECNTQIQPIRTAEDRIAKKAHLYDQKELTPKERLCRNQCETEHYKELKVGWNERRKAKNKKRR